MKLKVTIEKMEDIMSPTDVFREDLEVPRLKKWIEFFENPENYDDYELFYERVKSISDNPVTLAELVTRLYDVLNNRIRRFVDFEYIGNTSFREKHLRLI